MGYRSDERKFWSKMFGLVVNLKGAEVAELFADDCLKLFRNRFGRKETEKQKAIDAFCRAMEPILKSNAASSKTYFEIGTKEISVQIRVENI